MSTVEERRAYSRRKAARTLLSQLSLCVSKNARVETIQMFLADQERIIGERFKPMAGDLAVALSMLAQHAGDEPEVAEFLEGLESR